MARGACEYDENLEHEPDFFATLDGHRSTLRRSLLPSTATPADERTPFRVCTFSRKGIHPSAIAAVTPDGGCNWDGCRGTRAALRRGVEYPSKGGGGTRAAPRRVGFSAQEVDASLRWRSGFPRIVGRLVLSRCFLACQAPWTTARCRCQAATEHRIDSARLVLHPIWNDEIELRKRKPKRTPTQSAILRGRQDCSRRTLVRITHLRYESVWVWNANPKLHSYEESSAGRGVTMAKKVKNGAFYFCSNGRHILRAQL